jgi:hypothetical protein
MLKTKQNATFIIKINLLFKFNFLFYFNLIISVYVVFYFKTKIMQFEFSVQIN